MKKLHVHYAGWGEDFCLGSLAEDGPETLFEYSPAALQRKLELSPFKYQLSNETFASSNKSSLPVPGFIHDSLPDGWGLLLMDRAVLRSGRNPATLTTLDRLAIIGANAFGALRFVPASEMAVEREDADILALARAVRKIESGQSTDLLPLLQKVGSPQGARPKAAVSYSPTTGIMSTGEIEGTDPWLIKFPAKSEEPEVCAIEAVYALLAAKSGIRIPQTGFFPLAAAKSAAFGVARFDREGGRRVPIQSFAALMDVDFRGAMADYRELLRMVMLLTRDRREVEQMFLRCVFNVVYNNRDDHLKNFAFRMERMGEWKLSPAFDLTFSEGHGGEHWNTVMSKGKNITREDLLALGKAGGLTPAVVDRLIEQVLQSVPSWPRLARRFPIGKETQTLIQKKVTGNAQLCRTKNSIRKVRS
jgi:serine/threonine-protein kinase HipA